MAAQVQPANQGRPANYKYTTNMRNPPTQNIALVPSQTNVQAVHVKGKLKISLVVTLRLRLTFERIS